MQDLLHGFTDPNVIDIKMGTRTFLESEVTNTTARSDLYQKVITYTTPHALQRKKIKIITWALLRSYDHI
jgi:1D-myo-inositol-triphosphate 3-kinase